MKTFFPVNDSSSIRTIEYVDETRILTVEFVGGGKYTYAEVPGSVFEEFLEADSKGKYFAAHIKDKYVTERMSGVRLNPPKPWRHPKDEDFTVPPIVHGSDVAAAWPFPTGKRPE